MGRTFAELEEMYRKVVRRFNKIELQEWRAVRRQMWMSTLAMRWQM